MKHVTIGFGSGTKKAGNPSGITNVLSGSFNSSVTWVNPNSSLYDYVNIERQLDGGAWVLVNQPAKGTTNFIDSPGYSVDAKYRIYASKGGWQVSDTNTAANAVRTLPAAPSPQSLTVANGGWVYWRANSPGHGKIVGFDAVISTDNGASWSGNYDAGADPNFDWSGIGHGLNVRAMGRTRDSFGQVSAWAAWGTYIVSINDTVGPVVGACGQPVWTGIGAGRGTSIPYGASADPVSGISNIWMERSTVGRNGGAWEYQGGVLQEGGNFFDPNTAGEYSSYRMGATDGLGNTTYGAQSPWFWSRPWGTKYVYATQVDYWTDAVGWRNGWVAYSDNAGSRGAFFYVNAADGSSGWQNVCHGYVPDSASIYLVKKEYNPGESGSHDLQLMTNIRWDDLNPGGGVGGSAPNLVGGGFAGPVLLAPDEASEWPIANKVSMGLGSSHGICLIDSGGPRRLHGVNTNPSSGRIKFVFNT